MLFCVVRTAAVQQDLMLCLRARNPKPFGAVAGQPLASTAHWSPGRKELGSNPPSSRSLCCIARASAASDLENDLHDVVFKTAHGALDYNLLTVDLYMVTGSQMQRILENFSWMQLKWAEMPRHATEAGYRTHGEVTSRDNDVPYLVKANMITVA